LNISKSLFSTNTKSLKNIQVSIFKKLKMAFFIKQNLCLKVAKLYNENGFTIVVIAIISG